MFDIKRKADGLIVSKGIAPLVLAIDAAKKHADKHRKTYAVVYQSGAPVVYVNARGEVSWHKQSDRELQSPLTSEVK